MAEDVRILLLADSDREVTWLTATLRAGNCQGTVVRVADEAACRVKLEEEPWDLVLAALSETGPPAALRGVRQRITGVDPPLVILAERFEEAAEPAQRLGASVCLRAGGFAQLGPLVERARRERPYRSERPGGAAFEEGQREILESIATGKPLPEILEQIVLLIERQGDGMLCSILLLDREAGCMRHGAAPHLPDELNRGVEGAPIGPTEGSCGAAAHLGKPVIIDDIATHPNWASYRQLALPFGLRACWSTPILAPGGGVLGTFAMYYREARLPTPRERHWVNRAAHLASIAISREAAERAARKADARYRESVETLQLMYGAVSDIVFFLSVDPAGGYRFLSVNPAFLRATGMREDQIVGRDATQVIPEPSRAVALANYARAIEQRTTVTWDEVSVYPAGTKYGEVSITPIFDGAGRCTNLLGTVHDVTERRNSERRLAAQAALLDKAKDAILVVDLDGTIRYWNKGAERLYGWSSEEAMGCSVRTLIHPDGDRFDSARRMMMAAGEWSGQLRQINKAGRTIISEVSATVIRDEHGQASSVFAIGTDITERRQLEAQVFHAQRLDSLGTLAGGVAHDFNNLLAAILGNVALAQREVPADHPAHELLLEVEIAGQRGAALVKQLLTFSRREQPTRHTVKLQPLVDQAIRLLRASLPRTLNLETHFAADAPEVLADPTQIHQIVMNLGTNAAHAMNGCDGSIQIQVERVVLEGELDTHSAKLRPGTYARLVVADPGCGIDEETLERIFDPFYTTKGPGQGTGLGLSVVHGIVRNHDGGIVVHSTLGQGTEFSVSLPQAPAR
jgi:PAS domain S-box-containing protein